ncbi:hypothetical protein BTO07_05165 [Polaribacter sp. SA4-12]|nr:hypothetical protein BTO07_05165 [Polaribacter sp. SA4-12]
MPLHLTDLDSSTALFVELYILSTSLKTYGLQILHGVKLYLEISMLPNNLFETFSTILKEDK